MVARMVGLVGARQQVRVLDAVEEDLFDALDVHAGVSRAQHVDGWHEDEEDRLCRPASESR